MIFTGFVQWPSGAQWTVLSEEGPPFEHVKFEANTPAGAAASASRLAHEMAKKTKGMNLLVNLFSDMAGAKVGIIQHIDGGSKFCGFFDLTE